MGIIYNLIFMIFAVLYTPVFLLRRRKRQGIGIRFGIYPRQTLDRLKRHRNIWVHAVSIGEVKAVSSLVDKLRGAYPEETLVITTVTETGNAVAKRLAGERDTVLFLPFDITFIIRRAISHIRPSLLVIMETEIWPNLITECYNKNIPVMLVNGRISDRSFKKYYLIRFMLKPILKKIALFIMQSSLDSERIISLGADAGKVKAAGSMKFDAAASSLLNEGQRQRLRSLLGLAKEARLIIAGSTHPKEEEAILSCFSALIRRHKDVRLLIAPRHVERSTEIEDIISKHGFIPRRVSRLTDSLGSKSEEACDFQREIFILDTVGQLKNFYSIADIVFVGGSLIRKGGQNMLEPAVFAKPILFGPHIFNFRDIASAFLKGGAAIMVNDTRSLAKAVEAILEDPGLSKRLGQKAKEVVDANRGATDFTLNAIRNIYPDIRTESSLIT